ncbi:DUF4910 domain-containing protein [Candidatus Gracilibacteria bacterium]|nr:DUF4910 domain-containing protein [Candidatus Gracilibacteria bacterium]
MYQRLVSTIDQEVSGVAARNLVARISQWHRIQASPMYREAAQWLIHTLRSWGIESDIESYTSREGLWAWGEPLFQEWWCDEAWLDLRLDDGRVQRLADYRVVPLSLIPRSAPADGEFEVVAIEGGEREADYAGVDVRGKLVLTRSMPMAVQTLAVERYGAAGVLFDGMRSIPEICPSGDLPDEIQYASWWWWGGETRAFGFALSPRAGKELRQRLEAGPLRVAAHVRSHFADGQIEAVTATIPGESEDQVLLVAHLCHPTPFANDNASGAAAVMEAARALHTLVQSGTLPRPRRTLRFLWVPEMTGTYLYLASHEAEIARTVAALNLDMVGEDEAQTGSSWLLVRPSEALPHFAADLLEALREQFWGAGHTFDGRSRPPLYRHAVVPYSNGSDHYIFGDPTVGIGTPMLVQWPDRFYHTTGDTLDKVSAKTLQRNTTLAASYLYAAGNAGPTETDWLASEMNARFIARLSHELQSAVSAALGGDAPPGVSWERKWQFRTQQHALALTSLQKLNPQFDPAKATTHAHSIAAALWAQQREVLGDWHSAEVARLNPADAALIPRRRYRGPVSLAPHLLRLSTEERLAARATLSGRLNSLAADVALYWADGERALGAIVDLVELELDLRAPTEILSYFRLLARLELVDL